MACIEAVRREANASADIGDDYQAGMLAALSLLQGRLERAFRHERVVRLVVAGNQREPSYEV